MRYPCIMTNEDAEQLALDGLAPRKRRKRAPAVKTPAAEHPIAQVVLDIQATHLGQTFDYFVEEKYSAAAQPGVMVRVRFGGSGSTASYGNAPIPAPHPNHRYVTSNVWSPTVCSFPNPCATI